MRRRKQQPEVGLLWFCTCPSHTPGFVKREDGVWVKPCCRKPTETAWLAGAAIPSPGLPDCPGCITNDHSSTAPWRNGAPS